MVSNFNGFIMLKDPPKQPKPVKKKVVAPSNSSTMAKPSVVRPLHPKIETTSKNLSTTKKIYQPHVAPGAKKPATRPPPLVAPKVKEVKAPVAPSVKVPAKKEVEEVEPEEDYENDPFDDYQSDFESESESPESASDTSEPTSQIVSLQSSIKSPPSSLVQRREAYRKLLTEEMDLYEYTRPLLTRQATILLSRRTDLQNNFSQTYIHDLRVSSSTEMTEVQKCDVGVPEKESFADFRALKKRSEINIETLTQFLKRNFETVMTLLHKNGQKKEQEGPGAQLTLRNAFSKRDIFLVHTNPDVPNTILTVHKESDSLFVTQECLICVWNVMIPSEPLKILSCWNDITCLYVHHEYPDVIVGGSQDGALLVWNTQEKVQWNRQNPHHFHHAPSAVKHSEISDGAFCNVLKIEASSGFTNSSQSFKVVTLHEPSFIVEWLILILNTTVNDSKTDNSSLWSRIRIIQLDSQPVFSTLTPLSASTDVSYAKKAEMNDALELAVRESQQIFAMKARDLLVVDDILVVLTNTNVLFHSNQLKSFKKLTFHHDPFIFAVCACNFRNHEVALLLSNNTISFISVASRNLVTMNLPVLAQDRTRSVDNVSMSFNSLEDCIVIASESHVTFLYEVNRQLTRTMNFSKQIKAVRSLKKSPGTFSLAILFHNGEVLVQDYQK